MSIAMGWQAMGKPDFATCGKLFYRLPAEIRESLNRSEEKVLIWTLFLTWWQSVHSGRQTAIVSFSESWVGEKFSRSRWTVARALGRLESCALLKRIRRNPKKDGTYQTNLIALGARLFALIAPNTRQPRDKSPCSRTAPQEVGNGYKPQQTAQSAGSASLFATPSVLQTKAANAWMWKSPKERRRGPDHDDEGSTRLFALFERLKSLRPRN